VGSLSCDDTILNGEVIVWQPLQVPLPYGGIVYQHGSDVEVMDGEGRSQWYVSYGYTCDGINLLKGLYILHFEILVVQSCLFWQH